jgi:hypothetical protein
LQNALSEAWECAGSASFEGEDVLAGDRREVWASAGFVFALGSEDRGVQCVELGSELASGVAPPWRRQRSMSFRAISRSSRFGLVSASALGVPSGAKIACSRKPQK